MGLHKVLSSENDFGGSVLDTLREEGRAVEKGYKEYDQEELALGILVELEHADDVRIAEEIAKDHLEEDPNYYSDPDNPFREEIDDEYIAASLQPDLPRASSSFVRHILRSRRS